MGIIIRYVLRNIREKKMRTAMLLFSVALSAALIFASMALGGTLSEMAIVKIKGDFGSSNIYITPGEHAPSQILSPTAAYQLGSRIDYAIGMYSGSAIYKMIDKENTTIDIKGVDLADLQRMNPFKLISQNKHQKFDGNAIILNAIAADQYGLKVGDPLKLKINGFEHIFHLYAIAEPAGPFKMKGESTLAIMPRNTVSEIYSSRGKVNIIYIKATQDQDLTSLIDDLSKIYRKADIQECVTAERIEQETSMVATPFLMMTVIVLFMSAFIIYTSFKVISMERIPIIGVFRSIGATRKITDKVLLTESLAYGVLGGALGILLGFIILYAMSYGLAIDPWTGTVDEMHLKYSLLHIATAYSVAILVALLSALAPIHKVSKLPVKDIVLNHLEKHQSESKPKWPLACFLILIAFGIPILVPKSMLIIVGVLSILLCSIAITMLIPLLTKVMTRSSEGLFEKLFGNIGLLAVKNIRDNKNIQNNISLLAIGLASFIMISTVSYSVITTVKQTYKDMNSELLLVSTAKDRSELLPVGATEGVTDFYPYYREYYVPIKNSDEKIDVVYSEDPTRQNAYRAYNFSRETLIQLESGKNIAIDQSLADRANLKVGDTLTLETPTGDRDYVLVGLYKASFSAGYISTKNFKQDFKPDKYAAISIKTSGDPEKVKSALVKKLGLNLIWIETLPVIQANDEAESSQLFILLKGFSILTMVIGIFGILNNLIISFIQRKRHIAIFRSVGMSQQQIVRMIFAEAICGGLIGGTAGLISGYMLVGLLPYILKGLSNGMKIYHDPALTFQSLIAGVLITVLASISPALKARKENIIQSIKFE